MTPDWRMAAELERRAGAVWTCCAVAWRAQRSGDDRGALTALLCLWAVHEAAGARILSGEYLKSRPPGSKRPNLVDDAAHHFMEIVAARTGEQRAEVLARIT